LSEGPENEEMSKSSLSLTGKPSIYQLSEVIKKVFGGAAVVLWVIKKF
jgi:hypothetical protein